MFYLEPAFEQWRQEMRAAGIKPPLLLDELESHLRDEVEQQIHSGQTARQAFVTAVHRMGPATELKFEFETVRSNPDNPNETMKQKLISIAASVAVMFIAVGLILPAVAKLKEQGSLARFEIAMLLIGTTALTASAMFGAYNIANSLRHRPKA
jgi:hypothetical protein